MMSEDQEFLVPATTYLKNGTHIGTKLKTEFMEPFVYKTRSDGLSVLNIQEIDKRIRIAATFLAQYDPEEILIVSRRENGWGPAKKFKEIIGAKAVTGRYPPGMITNPNLEKFIEPKVLLVTDAWPDDNAVKDAHKIGIPVVALSDTNNQSNYIDLVVPCNNKGRKSLALVYYLLAQEYLRQREILKEDEELDLEVEDFIQ